VPRRTSTTCRRGQPRGDVLRDRHVHVGGAFFIFFFPPGLLFFFFFNGDPRADGLPFFCSLARQYFRTNVYHSFDVDQHYIDQGPPTSRWPDTCGLWVAGGGRYRMSCSIGCDANGYEVDRRFPPNRTPTKFRAYPDAIHRSGSSRTTRSGRHRHHADKVARDVEIALRPVEGRVPLSNQSPAGRLLIANNKLGGQTTQDHVRRQLQRTSRAVRQNYVETNLSSLSGGDSQD